MMYTLGSSQIRWIANQQSLSILDNKLVGFVGTASDRTSTNPEIGLNQYTVFFDITNAPTTVTVYGTVMVNGAWAWDTANAVTITDPTVLLQNLKTASGWTQTVIAVQRGDNAGMSHAAKVDGALYFNRQSGQLLVFDGTVGQWRSVSGSGGGMGGIVGTIFGWPSSQGVPMGFLRCDGSSHLIADYPILFGAIGYTYGGSGLSFQVPTNSNSIILAQA